MDRSSSVGLLQSTMVHTPVSPVVAVVGVGVVVVVVVVEGEQGDSLKPEGCVVSDGASTTWLDSLTGILVVLGLVGVVGVEVVVVVVAVVVLVVISVMQAVLIALGAASSSLATLAGVEEASDDTIESPDKGCMVEELESREAMLDEGSRIFTSSTTSSSGGAWTASKAGASAASSPATVTGASPRMVDTTTSQTSELVRPWGRGKGVVM